MRPRRRQLTASAADRPYARSARHGGRQGGIIAEVCFIVEDYYAYSV